MSPAIRFISIFDRGVGFFIHASGMHVASFDISLLRGPRTSKIESKKFHAAFSGSFVEKAEREKNLLINLSSLCNVYS